MNPAINIQNIIMTYCTDAIVRNNGNRPLLKNEATRVLVRIKKAENTCISVKKDKRYTYIV